VTKWHFSKLAKNKIMWIKSFPGKWKSHYRYVKILILFFLIGLQVATNQEINKSSFSRVCSRQWCILLQFTVSDNWLDVSLVTNISQTWRHCEEIIGFGWL
jgi:hypothetical protein